MNRNFVEYHKSIAEEMASLKNRIRNLIGSSHHLTDGEFKEIIVRKTLRNHLPKNLSVAHGFVCFPEGNSTQLDIMTLRQDKPRIFQDGELAIVTSDAVEAIFEVKTRQQSVTQLKATLNKLADNAEKIRKNGNSTCKAGLFIHENQRSSIDHDCVLEAINASAKGSNHRVIDWVAYGNNHFYRFWFYSPEQDRNVCYTKWHSYKLDKLAHAYFISNVIWDLSGEMNKKNQFAWFPLPDGKENSKIGDIEMDIDYTNTRNLNNG